MLNLFVLVPLVIDNDQYSINYDDELKCPISSYYELTVNEKRLNELAPRKEYWHEFESSAKVNEGWYELGYDRGHIIPAEDMQYTDSTAKQSYSMYNVCPQNSSMNRGGWNRLEQYVRSHADSVSVKIWTGVHYSDSNTKVGSAIVPTHFWKVFCIKDTICEGYFMPNRKLDYSFRNYKVDVSKLKTLTKIDFK